MKMEKINLHYFTRSDTIMAKIYSISHYIRGGEMRNTTVFDVAKDTLEKLGTMTTMKLQKLVYYCQAWSLVWDEEPLFEEDFQAWANGPVCTELYNQHRGLFNINSRRLRTGDSSLLNSTQIETINSVLDYYGGRPAHWLSMLTHKENPWIYARKGVQDGEPCENIITKESMILYYDSLS